MRGAQGTRCARRNCCVRECADDGTAVRTQEFKVALEADTWGQIEEAKEGYERYSPLSTPVCTGVEPDNVPVRPTDSHAAPLLTVVVSRRAGPLGGWTGAVQPGCRAQNGARRRTLPSHCIGEGAHPTPGLPTAPASV